MNIKHGVQIAVIALLLNGCAATAPHFVGSKGGYVQSDIPGLAEALMHWHVETMAPRCLPGENPRVRSEFTWKTTSLGLVRERYQYKLTCTTQEVQK